MPSYKKELDFAKDLADQAAKIMKRYFRAEDIGIEWKEDKTPVTQADTKINRLVIDEVKKQFPDHGVIGEEESHNTDAKFVWVVDPVDGTMPFSIGIPVSTFSLALVDHNTGNTIVGVVCDPALKHVYWAEKGKGAFLNDVALKVSIKNTLEGSYLSIIGGTSKLAFGGQVSVLARENGALYVHLMSQAYSAAKVATGELHGSIFGYGAPWDCAAVSLIVEEAGGIVTDLHGNRRRHDEWGEGCILSANDEIHRELLKIVNEAMRDE